MGAKLLLLLALVVPAEALARDVYFNGVKLDSHVVVTNRTFPNCEVRFDANGNLFITARGYKASLTQNPQEPAAAPTEDTPGRVTRRYWVVAPQPKRGQVQYDIEVYLNGTFVKRVRSGDDKAIVEVTRHVRPGTNQVRVVATKQLGDRRISSSPQDYMEIVVGEGVVGGGTITIDRAVVTYRRTAAEMGNFADSFSFTSR
jgi:hypothetical protein